MVHMCSPLTHIHLEFYVLHFLLLGALSGLIANPLSHAPAESLCGIWIHTHAVSLRFIALQPLLWKEPSNAIRGLKCWYAAVGYMRKCVYRFDSNRVFRYLQMDVSQWNDPSFGLLSLFPFVLRVCFVKLHSFQWKCLWSRVCTMQDSVCEALPWVQLG